MRPGQRMKLDDDASLPHDIMLAHFSLGPLSGANFVGVETLMPTELARGDSDAMFPHEALSSTRKLQLKQLNNHQMLRAYAHSQIIVHTHGAKLVPKQ